MQRLAAAAIGGFVLSLIVVGLARASAPDGRYVITDGEVYDTKTKLTWQQTVARDTDGGVLPRLENAQARCQTPWRVPGIKELETLIDESMLGGALVDPSAFPDTPNVPLWSDTHSNRTPWDYRVFVLLPDGTTTTEFTNGTDFGGGYVRCVK